MRSEHCIIRLQSIEIENFMNIEYGHVRFPCNLKKDIFEQNPDIMGVYGQNGSGKTSLIHILTALEAMLAGRGLTKNAKRLVTAGQDSCRLKYFFSIQDDSDIQYKASYQFTLDKDGTLTEERLSFSFQKENRWNPLIIAGWQSSANELLSPRYRLALIVGKDQDQKDQLRLAKKACIRSASSFLFCDELLAQTNPLEESLPNHFPLFQALSFYGKHQLHIIANRSTELCYLSTGRMSIALNGSTLIPESGLPPVNRSIYAVNLILEQIVPGLTIAAEPIGRQLTKDSKPGVIIELSSRRNGTAVPFAYESDGIKKIVSILHMLVTVYSNPSMTLAIDEMDSGVFEYLLGELLRILSQSGKGQLIFTSHNLRPLEVLPRNSILFTTSNPANRYIRLGGKRTGLNLRDHYYHDLILGGQKESIYQAAGNYTINRAFRLAGDDYGR